MSEKNIEISRKYTVSAGENSTLSTGGTGSDWNIEVSVQGPVDPKTQLVLNLIDLDEIVLPILNRIDKKHLNLQVEPLKDKIISPNVLSEYLFQTIGDELESRFLNLRLTKIKVSRIGAKEWGSCEINLTDTEDL